MGRDAGFPMGTRVALVALVERYPTGVWHPGTTGVVVVNDPQSKDEVVGAVRLDTHNPDLDEWDNCLHVYDPAIVDGERGWADWVAVEGGQ